MKKKFIFSIVLVFLLTVMVSSTAFAAAAPAQETGQRIYGQVVVLGAEDFTILTPEGEQYTYLTDARTIYRGPQHEAPGIDDLLLGTKLAVFARSVSEGTPVARLVILLPADFDPNEWADVRASGQVTDVNIETDLLTLQTSDGLDVTFQINGETRIFGHASQLAEIQIGWHVAVGGVEGEGDAPLAKHVLIVDSSRSRARAGIIVEVSSVEDTFTLLTRNEEEITFIVDENTLFRSRHGDIESLDGLEVEMFAIVLGNPKDDGVWIATQLAVGDAEDLPDYDTKVGGQITAIGEHDFILETRSGDVYVFQVDSETRFRGWF